MALIYFDEGGDAPPTPRRTLGGAAAASRVPIKISFLGKSGVGKTTLIAAIRHLTSSSSAPLPNGGGLRGGSAPPTIGVEFFTVSAANDELLLRLWDTAGMERFAPITSAYTRDAGAIVLMYDVSDAAASFDDLSRRWLPLVEAERGTSPLAQPLVFVVGNKMDCVGSPPPEMHVERAYAKTIGAESHALVSALNAHSVHAFLCNELCPRLLKSRTQLEADARTALGLGGDDDANSRRHRRVIVQPDDSLDFSGVRTHHDFRRVRRSSGDADSSCAC